MAAVAGGADAVHAAIAAAGLSDRVCVAAINSPRHTTVSGCPEALQQLAAAARLASAPLRVRHAFHSPAVEAVSKIFTDTLSAAGWPECGGDINGNGPDGAGTDSEVGDTGSDLAAKFLEEEDDGSAIQAEIRRLLPKQRACAFASTTTGALAAPAVALDVAHWLDNLRRAVQFAPAVAAMAGECDIMIELGPTAVLGPCIAATVPGKVLRGMATKAGSALGDAFETAAQLWLGGAHVDWRKLVAPGPPGAPFPHKVGG